jgi:hypothetical protein
VLSEGQLLFQRCSIHEKLVRILGNKLGAYRPARIGGIETCFPALVDVDKMTCDGVGHDGMQGVGLKLAIVNSVGDVITNLWGHAICMQGRKFGGTVKGIKANIAYRGRRRPCENGIFRRCFSTPKFDPRHEEALEFSM